MTKEQAMTTQKISAIVMIALSVLGIVFALIILLAGSFLANLSLEAVEQVIPDMVSDLSEIVDSKGLITMTIGLISGFMIIISLYGLFVGIFTIKQYKKGEKALTCLILDCVYILIAIITFALFKAAPVFIISLLTGGAAAFGSATHMQKYNAQKTSGGPGDGFNQTDF